MSNGSTISEKAVFEPGRRVRGEGRAIYEIGECRARTPWWHLYSGRKVFFNYRYHEREYYEAAADEWLDVQIRAVGDFCSGASADALRERLRFEAAVLAKQSTWFPEPIDVVEVAPDRGEGSAALLLVTSKPSGQSLGEWAVASREYLAWKFAVCLELLEVLGSLHRDGNVLGAFGPDDFWIDESSRLVCTAADRIVSAMQSGGLRPFFSPERYPARYAAAEVLSGSSAFDARADLYSWAAVTVDLVTASGLDESAGGSTELPSRDFETFEAAVRQLAAERPDVLRGLSARLARSAPAALVGGWMRAIATCLETSPANRPASVDELERQAGSRKKSSMRKLLQQWLGD